MSKLSIKEDKKVIKCKINIKVLIKNHLSKVGTNILHVHVQTFVYVWMYCKNIQSGLTFVWSTLHLLINYILGPKGEGLGCLHDI